VTALQLRLVTGSVWHPGSSGRRAKEKEKERTKGKRVICVHTGRSNEGYYSLFLASDQERLYIVLSLVTEG
jgi:hypothetical protein